MRTVIVSDSFMTAVLRVFIAVAVGFTLLLCTLSIASVAQNNLQFFPRSFDFEVGTDGSVLFDHKIVNVTLYPNNIIPLPIVNKAVTLKRSSLSSTSLIKDTYESLLSDHKNRQLHSSKIKKMKSKQVQPESLREGYGDIYAPQKKPHYAACCWKWHSLSLFDFALLSEAAYFDERQGNQVQQLINTLMPEAGFKVRINSRDLSLQSQGGRPMYLELTSETLGVTVLAIRGTDVGRIHDFMVRRVPMFSHSCAVIKDWN